MPGKAGRVRTRVAKTARRLGFSVVFLAFFCFPPLDRAMRVFLLATLDTKGAEAAFVAERLRAAGCAVTLVDAGCLGESTVPADVGREAVFAAAGERREELVARGARGAAVAAAAMGAARLVKAAFDRREVAGVMAIGGSAGTTIGTAAMRALPLGVPKLMVSTLASGQVRPWVADKDIAMVNSVVDIAGLNRISRPILANAAAAMAGMVRGREDDDRKMDDRKIGVERPLIAATMFGVTTPCVQAARKILEEAGYEVLVFHATGNGGQAMESLIAEGLIAGVLDITTTELADELVGGILSAGPERLTAAARCGVPQVVSVGALDMVNFGPRNTVPEKFHGRQFHEHNATVTLMRTTPDENRRLGEEIGRKVAASKGPAAILLPRQGVSAIDCAGKPFDDPAARESLFAAIRESAGSVQRIELDCHINDPTFAAAAAGKLLELMRSRRKP